MTRMLSARKVRTPGTRRYSASSSCTGRAPAAPAPRRAPRRRSASSRRNGFSRSGPRLSASTSRSGSGSGAAAAAAARPPPNGPAGPDAPPGAANGPADAPPAQWKPKVESGAAPLHPPPSPGAPSASPAAPPASPAPGPASATPSQRRRVSAATSANDSFEIRPAPRPDLDAIPAGDLQARALAGLRADSRNSFVFVPRPRAARAAPRPEPAAPQEPGAGGSLGPGATAPGLEEGSCPPPPAAGLPDRAAGWPRPPSPPPSPKAAAEGGPAPGPRAPGSARNSGGPGGPGLPVTFIDEVDSEDEAPPEAKPPPAHPPGPQRPGGHTFVVVPGRKPGPAGAEVAAAAGSPPGTPAAPKKRYPAAHEIQVIGGYLAPQRSCLSKAGSSRKKMKISFNDESLQTTFEYPSESSLARAAAEEAEARGEAGDSDDEDSPGPTGASTQPFRLPLPRATFVGSDGPQRPPASSSSLASYTPKHAVAFSKWEEQERAQSPIEAEPPPPPEEAMLTPAGQDDLSDFRSEPALYF